MEELVESAEYYVYSHSHQNKVFYIGMGKNGRAFDFKDPSRGRKWKDFVSNTPMFKVTILKRFKDREEALAHEKKLILKLRPVTNSKGLGRTLKIKLFDQMKKPVTLSEAGKLGAAITNSMRDFDNRSKAAKKGWRLRNKRLKEEKVKVTN